MKVTQLIFNRFFQPNYFEKYVIDLKLLFFGLLEILYLSLSILNLEENKNIHERIWRRW